MKTFKTQNLHTAAAIAAIAHVYACDYLTPEKFFLDFAGVDATPALCDVFHHIVRIGNTAIIALEAVCMDQLFTDAAYKAPGSDQLSTAADLYKMLLKMEGRVFDDVQIGGFTLKHKHFLDKLLKQITDLKQ